MLSRRHCIAVVLLFLALCPCAHAYARPVVLWVFDWTLDWFVDCPHTRVSVR